MDLAATEPRRPAGAAMLHPVVLAAVLVLVVNDHILKAAYGNWLTGKLSDVAGLLLFPVLLVSAVELAAAAAGRRWRTDRRALAICAAPTIAAFSLVELAPFAESLYNAGLGLAQTPARALTGVPSGPVTSTADVTDLLALPAAVVPLLLHRGAQSIVDLWRSQSCATLS